MYLNTMYLNTTQLWLLNTASFAFLLIKILTFDTSSLSIVYVVSNGQYYYDSYAIYVIMVNDSIVYIC